jgi:hypothetical protein
MPPDKEDLYAIEGNICTELECLIKLKYGNKIRKETKLGNIENI